MRRLLFLMLLVVNYANAKNVNINLQARSTLKLGVMNTEVLVASGTINCVGPHKGFIVSFPYATQVSRDGVFNIVDDSGDNFIYLKVIFEGASQEIKNGSAFVFNSNDITSFNVFSVANQNISSVLYRLTIRASCFN